MDFQFALNAAFKSQPMDRDQMELVAKGEHMAERMLTLREVSAHLECESSHGSPAGEVGPVTRYQGWSRYEL